MDIPLIVDDICELYWRPLSDRERTAADLLLTRAWGMLQQQAPGMVTAVEAGSVATETVEQVLTQAVFRVLNNPAGRKQQSTSVDDYTASWVEGDAAGSLFFTPAELQMIDPLGSSGGNRGRVFTIDIATHPPLYMWPEAWGPPW